MDLTALLVQLMQEKDSRVDQLRERLVITILLLIHVPCIWQDICQQNLCLLLRSQLIYWLVREL